MLAYFAQKLQKFVKKWMRKITFRAEKLSGVLKTARQAFFGTQGIHDGKMWLSAILSTKLERILRPVPCAGAEVSLLHGF